MVEAYSRLKFLMAERSLTAAELQRRVAGQEHVFNVKAFYRLADPYRPLERVDLRIVGAICRILAVGLGEVIVFVNSEHPLLRALADDDQRRLDELLNHHDEGRLSEEELIELRGLVDRAEAIARGNARRLAAHQRRLEAVAQADKPAAAS